MKVGVGAVEGRDHDVVQLGAHQHERVGGEAVRVRKGGVGRARAAAHGHGQHGDVAHGAAAPIAPTHVDRAQASSVG